MSKHDTATAKAESSSGKGTVVAVCLRPDSGVPKHPQAQVTVGPHGIEGDRHAGPVTLHRGQISPNRRQVSILAKEVIDEFNRELDINIPPGGLGENIMVEGLGDLSDLAAGDRLRFSSGVVLEITAQNDPCKSIMTYHKLLPKRAYGKRGLVAIVRTPGELKPGAGVELSRQASRTARD